MSVTVSGANPIVLTGTTAASQEVLVNKNSLIVVKRITFLRPTTAGDKLTLTDKYGNVIVNMEADGDGLNQYQDIGVAYDGIYVTDMDSGSALIYIQ
jgi:hypothetical protein